MLNFQVDIFSLAMVLYVMLTLPLNGIHNLQGRIQSLERGEGGCTLLKRLKTKKREAG